MTLYAYKAMDAVGHVVAGRMNAANAVDLEMRLKRMELDFIRGNPVRPGGIPLGRRAHRRDLINFCFHLEQLTRAGVPIMEALADLRDSLANPRFRETMAGLIESVDGGKTLSQAMAEHPDVFDKVFVSLVAAGESTNRLPQVLAKLLESLKWQDELAAQTKKLATYPAFMGTVVVAVVLFMLTFLVPRMVGFIQSAGQDLPVHTRLLILTSDFVVHHWYLALGLPLLAVIATAAAVRTSAEARYRLDEFKLRLPVAGGILRKIILARFADVFAMMYASGISVLDCLRATEGVVGNRVIRHGLQRAGELIAEGRGIAAAFQDVGLFSPLVVRMLRVGENTGSLDGALANVSYFYGRDVRESIARLQTLIEPLLTVVLGLVLGWVMLAVLGPIYETIVKLKL